MYISRITTITVLLFSQLINAYDMQFFTKKINNNTKEIKAIFNLDNNEILYKDSFNASVNNPEIKLTEPKTSSSVITFFDENFGKNKEGYKNKVEFTFQATKNTNKLLDKSIITTHFSVYPLKEPQQKTLSLSFNNIENIENTKNNLATNSQATESKFKEQLTCPAPEPSLISGFMQNIIDSVSSTVQNWRNKLGSMFTETGSNWIRLIAALILGILLSLTPCIYPMIPITVGVLHINQSQSTIRSFFMATSYTLGISLTFALFGLIAAIGSCIFGQLQGSPWTVIPLALLLIYFGLSMLDFYEIYIPRFLQPKSRGIKGGSFLSAFAFGIVSGTVASPCLSPGLLLILDYVSHLSVSGNIFSYIEGFILLFVFGIGASLPLLIIGTFSGSLNFMPRAGMWMIEIKKLIGLLLIGMAFYHLSNLSKYIPWYILVWVITASIFALGVYYFASTKKEDSTNMKRYKNIMGTILIIISCIIAVQGYKSIYSEFYAKPEEQSIWLTDFNSAKEKSKQENKPMFIDLGSSVCMACKSIDKKILANSQVSSTLTEYYIPLKIDYDEQEESFNEIKKLYGPIKGFPTYLIVNPKGKLNKKLGSELGDLSINEVIELLLESK